MGVDDMRCGVMVDGWAGAPGPLEPRHADPFKRHERVDSCLLVAPRVLLDSA